MSDKVQNKADAIPPASTESSVFSNQATGLLETTFAETLGLSMHNAVTNQQSSQMTTSASVTNACARLLKTPSMSHAKAPEKDQDKVENQSDIEPKKSFVNSLSRLFKKGGKKQPE